MEWNPEPQDQGPFWPGAAERRSPRWVPILVAVALVIVVVGGVIWWLGRDTGDDGDAPAADETEELSQDNETDEAPAADDDDDGSAENAVESGSADDGSTEDGSTTTSTSATTSTTTTVQATTTTITTVPPDNPEQFGPPTLSNRSTVSTVGLDEVHFGMTVAAAQQAAGTVLVPAGPTGACYHVVPHDAPDGIVFLVHSGTIERVDINSGPITTRSGVGVGSPESMVTDLFGDRIEREVRVDGTVDLVFVPRDAGDQDYRVVFNISEGAVRAFKSGRLPMVMLDTGCETS
ncbi:MAG: hypothetical protein F4Y99_14060 [Acidimicrobiaceae bacterium]|nr:hypothetical protein [Acidimicrobiaceae bacterium]MDE0517606.1 hypothetical protein [Acidimicrobiaceae bacterium]MXZ97033.1 hypothetical protein [Acidimicrobiaceae bacterium]MYF44167.1 hypothetical protein [Acidimicrobiaceae bacterium]MYJ34335.1 hypothetical protein [Acidimicrobiaceae bacterium]